MSVSFGLITLLRRIEKSWDKQTGKNLAVDTSLGSGSSGLGFFFFFIIFIFIYFSHCWMCLGSVKRP